MFTLIKECVSAMAYLQTHQIPHQNIRPNTIYITRRGTIKMTDPVSFQQTPNYATLLTQGSDGSNKNFIYLSPVLLTALEKNDYSPNHNQY